MKYYQEYAIKIREQSVSIREMLSVKYPEEACFG